MMRWFDGGRRPTSYKYNGLTAGLAIGQTNAKGLTAIDALRVDNSKGLTANGAPGHTTMFVWEQVASPNLQI